MPVCHQKDRKLTNMEDDANDEENNDRINKVRRNLFGNVTEEDRRRTEEELKEISDEGVRKLAKYKILEHEKTSEKVEHPETRPTIESESEVDPESVPEVSNQDK